MDRSGFEEFVRARHGALLQRAFLLCGDWQRAEDLVQTTYEKLYRGWRSASAAADLNAYATKALLNTYLSWRRRRWHGEHATASPPEEEGADATAAVDLRLAVTRALGSLSAQQRAVLILRYLEDASETETAAILGCAVGTVKSRTARALAELRRHGVIDKEALRP